MMPDKDPQGVAVGVGVIDGVDVTVGVVEGDDEGEGVGVNVSDEVGVGVTAGDWVGIGVHSALKSRMILGRYTFCVGIPFLATALLVLRLNVITNMNAIVSEIKVITAIKESFVSFMLKSYCS